MVICHIVVVRDGVVLMEKRGRRDYRYLAINTGSSISTSSTYIVFLTKLQKGESPRKGFALFKNDITTIFYRYDTCDL